MKNKKLLLAASALMLVSAISIKPAMAYFTSTQTAVAKVAVAVGDSKLTGTDTVDNMVKKITIQNTGDFECFIRVRALAPSDCTLEFDNSESWSYSQADGYYYFANTVAPGSSTSELDINISVPTSAKTEGNDFNVIIIEEATKVHYDKKGDIEDANWSETGIVSNTENAPVEIIPVENTTEEVPN